ncbi:serine hydrolase domain-containing protein [Nonomuraea indica]|uniref:Serine hydrolase domain-containing protein n=1 Tax=Nonomuraea indica TaxID=1581193 RepID=A0ABW8AAF5_9ACTN
MLLARKSSGRRALAGLLAALALWPPASAASAATVTPTLTATAPAPEPVTAEAAWAFLDEHVTAQLAELRIPGAAAAVVTDDGHVVARGYGVADVKSGRPVSAERTVFAPASVVKLVTATAVMQLVERGRIDLDADVNDYLTDFKVADAYPGRPVTTAHLLTHTAGFAAGDYGTGAASPEQALPLGEYLAGHQPRRIRPPGTRAVYSNYGMGLAGHLVELRSGMPFHRYVAEHVFRPLGMSHSSVAQPEPRHIAAALAPGHRLAGDRQVPVTGALYGHMPPHGAGFRSTATDMAAFMRAHLTGGGPILRPESVRLMQGRRFGNAEGTPGMGYGFQEYSRNGRRLVVHRGNIPGYFAILALVPDRGIGIYASYNGSGVGGPESVWKLVNAFADRFAPAAPPAATPSGPLPDPARYAGNYRPAQAADTDDLGRLAGLTGAVTVSAGGGGTLTTTGAVTHGTPETRHWTQVSPGLFQEKGGYRRLSFGEDGLLAGENPIGPLERLSWHQSPPVQLGLLGGALAVLLLSALGWPVASAVRRIRGRTVKAPRLAALPGWATAVLAVASAGTVVATFADQSNLTAFFLGGSPLLTAVHTLPVLAAVTTCATLAATALAWRRRWWSLAGRVHHTGVALAAVAYLAVAASYNLLG